MASTSIVLTSADTIIGKNCALIISKYSIMATPGGTKNIGRLLTKKSEMPFTHLSFTHPSFRNSVSNNIPIILDGSFTPLRCTMSSPSARHPKITTHCLIKISTLECEEKQSYGILLTDFLSGPGESSPLQRPAGRRICGCIILKTAIDKTQSEIHIGMRYKGVTQR